MTAEATPGRGPDSGQGRYPATRELPGLRRLAVFRGSGTFVPSEKNPDYLRRVVPQSALNSGGTEGT